MLTKRSVYIMIYNVAIIKSSRCIFSVTNYIKGMNMSLTIIIGIRVRKDLILLCFEIFHTIMYNNTSVMYIMISLTIHAYTENYVNKTI